MRVEARGDDYTLVISTPQDSWSAQKAIVVQAELAYHGALPLATIWGSGGGVIGFSVDEVNGDRNMDVSWDLSCARYTIGPGQAITIPYRKSGAFAAGDPNEAFYRAFFADPILHLPAGTWQISADAWFSTDGCGRGEVRLQASFRITVE